MLNAHKNSIRAYKNAKKNCKSFRLDKSNAVGVGMTAIKPNLSICPVGLVWFARYCGKMYSCHLFFTEDLFCTLYGGLKTSDVIEPFFEGWSEFVIFGSVSVMLHSARVLSDQIS